MKLRSKYKIYWRFGNMQMQIGFACFGHVFFAAFDGLIIFLVPISVSAELYVVYVIP